MQHTGDQYGDLQRDIYPTPAPGTLAATSPGFYAFDGFATLRTLSQGIVYTPNSAFNASLTLNETNNFPRTVPGLFGPAPFSVTGEVRDRVRPHLLIDFTRT